MLIYMWVLDVNGTYGSYDGTPNCVKAIDTEESVIWIDRYFEPGEFEIVLPADEEMFGLLMNEEIIFTREESPAVMYAEKVKLTTSAEDGDRITVSGRSIECWLDRRVVNKRTRTEGVTAAGQYMEIALFSLIREHFTEAARKRVFSIIDLDLTSMRPYEGTRINTEYFGENLLDIAVNYCRTIGKGLRFTKHDGVFQSGAYKYFTLAFYAGEDKSDTVIFSPEFGNISATEYERDKKGIFNAVYVYESKEKKNITTDTVAEAGTETGVLARDRLLRKETWAAAENGYSEKMTDASDGWQYGYYFDSNSRKTLVERKYAMCNTNYYPAEENIAFSGVKISQYETTCQSEDIGIYIFCFDENKDHLGTVSRDNMLGSVTYDNINSAKNVALPEGTKYVRFGIWFHFDTIYGQEYDHRAEVQSFRLTVKEREPFMQAQGARILAAQDTQETFFCETVDNGLYEYGKDYELGDIIKIENACGISATARITEISEKEDGEGYSLMPTLSVLAIDR